MRKITSRSACATLFSCAALALSSCNDDHPYPYAAAQQLATEATQRVCDILETCCNDANIHYEEQGCKAFHSSRIEQYFTDQTFLGAQLDPAAAKRCLDSIGQVSDGCPVERKAGYLTEACDWVFKGTVPLGGECDVSHGCATTPDAPLTCHRKAKGEGGFEESGVCIPNPPPVDVHGSAGQACTVTCIDLEGSGGGCLASEGEAVCHTSDGLYCSWESNTCVAQRGSGGACQGSDECAPETYCNFEDFKCAELRPLGADCTEGMQCGENYCISGTCQRPPRASPEWCVGRLPPPPQN